MPKNRRAPTPSPSRRMTTGGKAPQAKVSGPDKWDVTIYQCSRCDIQYKIKGRNKKPVCLLCEEMSKNASLRDELKKVVNSNDILQRDLARAKSQLTVLDGMREALEELGDQDTMFLKELVYRYRSAPDDVRVSQAVRKRRIESKNGVAYRHEVNGWVVDYRDVDPPERAEHVASSIGGVMLALQFSEALKMTGLKGAMEMLTKVLAKSMANG